MTAKKAEETKDLVTTKNNEVALPPSPAEFYDDMQDDMQGIRPRLPQISIIHGQGQMFKFPDGSKKTDFVGIILQKQHCNAYWKESFDQTGGGAPPDCSSMDGITPDMNSPDVQAEYCKTCDHDKFGSDGSRGKACKNMVRVHIMVEGCNVPYRLTLSPANLNAMNDYVSNIVLTRARPLMLVYTGFSLSEGKNKDGILFSHIGLTHKGDIVEPKLIAALRDVKQTWRSAMVGEKIEASEI